MREVQLTACSVDLGTGRVSEGRDEQLTPRELMLLVRLARCPGELVGRSELQALFDYSPRARTRAVDKAMSTLRAKVEADPARPDHLLTRRGEGYLFFHATLRPSDLSRPVPSSEGPWIGRSEEVRAWVERLQRDAGVHQLTGVGGIGKTRLARRLLPEIRDRVEVGPVWVDLSAARTSSEVCAAVADTLGTYLLDHAPAQRVASVLCSRPPGLYVLDNAEQVARPLAQLLTHWCAEAPSATFLCTTRSALPLRAPAHVLGPLGEDDAMRLLETLAPRDVPRDEALRELLRYLDGNPLAIELVASKLRTYTASEIRQALSRGEDLAVDHEDRPVRHRSLHACLQVSWSLLEPSRQHAVGALTSFANDFPASAARALLASGSIADPSAVEVLVHGHWLCSDGEHLSMAPAIRRFARDRAGAELRLRADVAHGAWVSDRIGGIPTREQTLGAGLCVARVDLADVVSAHRRAVARGDWPTAATMALAAWEELRGVGPFELGVTLLESVRLPPRHPAAALVDRQ
ncbi:MAG: winged helix-turn-helix domain-containing protein, partial [Myxococcales bacterium]|nr:winged helix-turn-helix domain-containing protein [Myxococcales bacterium]